jgi:hypothetical protein
LILSSRFFFFALNGSLPQMKKKQLIHLFPALAILCNRLSASRIKRSTVFYYVGSKKRWISCQQTPKFVASGGMEQGLSYAAKGFESEGLHRCPKPLQQFIFGFMTTMATPTTHMSRSLVIQSAVSEDTVQVNWLTTHLSSRSY